MENEKGFRQQMKEELQLLQDNAQYRQCFTTTPLDAGWLQRDGKRLLNLASNDYLGLAGQRQGLDVAAHWGASASRLIVGSCPEIAELEKEFANFKKTERCLVFGSGYMANAGVVSALVGRHDMIFSDRLNHASIVDGAILSRAKLLRYRHRDMNHLEALLNRTQHQPGRRLIVTDSIFSMDGSIANLQDLVTLKERYGALLMVDEAHSGGIYGAEGRGLVDAYGLHGKVDIEMGTFSKAYGCYGAYIAGDDLIIDYITNTARSFIFTTALPPVIIQQIAKHGERVRQGEDLRRDLLSKSTWFREQLIHRGFHIGESESHIIPLIVGDNETTMRMSDSLQQLGIAAVAIRPPTVPEGSARIRFTLMSQHRQEDLAWAIDQLDFAAMELGVE